MALRVVDSRGMDFVGMAAGGVHHLAQCITCHAWNADMSSTRLHRPPFSHFNSPLFLS